MSGIELSEDLQEALRKSVRVLDVSMVVCVLLLIGMCFTPWHAAAG